MCWTVKLQNSFNKLSNCENWQTYQTFFCKFCDCNFTSEQKTKERTYQITTNLFFPNLPLTVGTCCRGGFRRAFLSEGHGNAMRESAVGVPPNLALQYVLCYHFVVFIFPNVLLALLSICENIQVFERLFLSLIVAYVL